VARGFVEAVGGDLDVDDTPGGGATMVVRLPAMAQAELEAGSDADGDIEAPAGAVGEARREPEPKGAADGKIGEPQ
jgi:two-component system sensor histidine kinase KdpD